MPLNPLSPDGAKATTSVAPGRAYCAIIMPDGNPSQTTTLAALQKRITESPRPEFSPEPASTTHLANTNRQTLIIILWNPYTVLSWSSCERKLP